MIIATALLIFMKAQVQLRSTQMERKEKWCRDIAKPHLCWLYELGMYINWYQSNAVAVHITAEHPDIYNVKCHSTRSLEPPQSRQAMLKSGLFRYFHWERIGTMQGRVRYKLICHTSRRPNDPTNAALWKQCAIDSVAWIVKCQQPTCSAEQIPIYTLNNVYLLCIFHVHT